MQNKQIALVNPSYSSYLYGSERDIKSVHPPLNLLYLHSYIKDIADVKLFDGELYPTLENLINDLEDFKPDIIAYTATSPSYPIVKKLAQKLKNKDRIQIIGGVYATVNPDEVLDFFNVAVIGEGEDALYDIIKGKKFEDIKGIAFRKKNNTFFTDNRPFKTDLDKLPFPSWDLVDFSKYQYSIHRGGDENSAPIITSRGCPYSCRNCSTQLVNGKIVRNRSPKNVGEEMDLLISRYGIQHFHFWDDTFTFDKNRLKDLCKEIKKRDVTFSCNTRPDVFSESDAELLDSAGCTNVFFGVESGNDEICRYFGRKIPKQKILDSFGYCKKNGIQTMASFMIGAPSETEETLRETLDFVHILKPDFVMFNILTPHKGTEIYKQAIDEGLLEDYTVDLEKFPEEPVGIPTIDNSNLNRLDLQNWKNKMYREYYDNNFLVNQFIKSIRNKNFKNLRTALKLRETYRK